MVYRRENRFLTDKKYNGEKDDKGVRLSLMQVTWPSQWYDVNKAK